MLWAHFSDTVAVSADTKENSTEGNIINVSLQPKYSRFIGDHVKNEK